MLADILLSCTGVITTQQRNNIKHKKAVKRNLNCFSVVVPPGIEPGTQGFSVLCSTN